MDLHAFGVPGSKNASLDGAHLQVSILLLSVEKLAIREVHQPSKTVKLAQLSLTAMVASLG